MVCGGLISSLGCLQGGAWGEVHVGGETKAGLHSRLMVTGFPLQFLSGLFDYFSLLLVCFYWVYKALS